MNTTPTLEMLDPATLTVDINVRKDAALTADFIASIKEHGVMEPVIAHRKDDGVVHVLMGQRRTRAAVEAGRTSIPVMIIESPEEAERIVTQVVENIQRAELIEADEADAYHQLSLIGVSAAAIAKKTGRTKTTVEGALKAKSSSAGSAALGKGYTIDEALIMTEFEGNQDATEELESVIADEPDQLLHVAQMLRDRRDRAAALTALIAELEAEGKTIVEDAGHYANEENLYVSAAKRADGEPATDEGFSAGENRVARLCSSQRIWSVFAKKRSLTRKAGPPVHDDHVRRDFTATAPDQLWLTDITEHRTDEGKLYLCAIKDVYSNRIVGYSIDSRMKASLAVSALHNAIALREPAGTVVHSDRGSQFRSNAFVRTLKGNGLKGSMGRVGACADNAAMESFFSLLQKNVLDRKRWSTRADLRLAMVTWIEKTYHRKPRQRRLGRLTPVEFETINTGLKAA